MTDTLYIIGNGFDLHHGLPTSYANFRDDYVRRNSKLWESLKIIYSNKIDEELWWRDFEGMLGEIDYKQLVNSPNGEAMGAFKVENLLKHQLPPLFGKWIKGMNANMKADMSLMLDNDALFFTFNYTLLLEKTYHINEDNVWHIHNSVKNADNIIIGHDFNNQEISSKYNDYRMANPDMYIRTDVCDWINQEIGKGAKKVKDRIESQKDCFFQYSGIKHIIAMGFSFNDIDMPYIEKIWSVNAHKDETNWLLYWHSDEEEELMKEKVSNLGVNENKIHMIKW